jgi:hypothetical protein
VLTSPFPHGQSYLSYVSVGLARSLNRRSGTEPLVD